MTVRESAFVFACQGDELVGIIAEPEQEGATAGVLIVVGGPQYRVGSHRQFVLLARWLAENGVPCMRFDYRGMGDSTGDERDFECIDDDLRAGVDTFFARVRGLREVVLWGLCDGASAACMYLPRDRRVSGAVLFNPWVRNAETHERVEMKHYYRQRLTDPSFWRKLLTGQVQVRAGVAAYAGKVFRMLTAGIRRSGGALPLTPVIGFRERLTEALAGFDGPVLLGMSGRDLVAAEFRLYMREDPRLAMWCGAPTTRCVDFPEADHTFSSRLDSRAAENATLEWLALHNGKRDENSGSV